MIQPDELNRIVASQLKSWSENRGVIGIKKITPLREKRMHWLMKMKQKLLRDKRSQ